MSSATSHGVEDLISAFIVDKISRRFTVLYAGILASKGRSQGVLIVFKVVLKDEG